jgi:hopene-associated glycosyltransferase HpnB
VPDLLIFLAAANCLIWFWLLLFHDKFWWADQRLANTTKELRDWPTVAIVVPARDEADVIELTVHSLLAQDYPGDFRIVLVDDHSSDDTAEAARLTARSERLTVVEAPPLPSGWTGKLAAMAYGTGQAVKIAPEHRYLLFTDADIEHPENSLRRLVFKAERDHRALVSLMVRLYCQSFWERLLVPAFVFFFQKLYPFPAVNNDHSKTAAAAGGVMLVRRSALESSGGIQAIHDHLIDDCALAELIKENQGRLWLGLADETRSIRPYAGIGEIWKMVARTAYTQLDYSPLKLLGAVLGMGLVYLLGPVLFLTYGFHSTTMASTLGLLAWLLMTCAYLPTIIYYRQPALLAACLPFIGFLYTLMTFDSALRHWCRQGGQWKGRTY